MNLLYYIIYIKYVYYLLFLRNLNQRTIQIIILFWIKIEYYFDI